ncbi:MAG: alpha-amylase family glycosyl hydrolase [Leptospiraceae bacterium]|nr:alpha-amylase family glycosyl hydrolase [Leptospiraceae bacterium]MDW8307264.1 alpha-amylase family glycosyl hydrolase [Leptospiraceae bacterium]
MPSKTSCLPFYFHLTREALKNYNILPLLPQLNSLASQEEIVAVRLFADHINRQRGKEERYLTAAEFVIISLLEEIYLYVLEKIEEELAPQIWAKALSELKERQSEILAEKYGEFFTPKEVVMGILKPQEYGLFVKGDEKALASFYNQLVLLLLENENPAMQDFLPLLTDSELRKQGLYRQNLSFLFASFQEGPYLGKKKNNLYHFLKEPVEAAPDSLGGQLEYIFQNWAEFLPQHLLLRLLKALDILREEEMLRGQAGASLETVLPDYSNRELFPDYEAFSPDRDWMPNLVMIAKSTYVWLYQLSRRYEREIKRLDQIPDEELDRLARWGISGLWLIGLWERSPASKKIKHLCGNTQAISSAYSLYDYTIAHELGGDEALENLKARCAQRGIRLGADMVPNHTGIYSRWIVENVDYFLWLPYSPFPSYRFTGENLSFHPEIGIYLEDGYYNRSDAAVVFKWVNFRTGETRYIYHGNDGTSTPWNDTAQIDYLNPRAREAVIETILNVARRFPIIRFDAAMTLAKRHIQRLWHPEPGQGGAIPSRAQFSKTREEFDKLMPQEFWREVVDRAAKEAPDTLLLAEAFWMMEGYFVRTLGMHRVYNSAFMNMLKREENQKYRNLVKETLEFNPEILKRYVNFMSNPDEETAVAQFSKGDKYFGVCLMMVTMPGLPMFAHGQIEGYSEKYGMEYARPYYDEYPDEYLIARHEREIFPLLHRRYLFSGVERFAFYDFVTPSGQVDENVFAYSNMAGGERALILYNNRYGDTSGYIKRAVPTNPQGKGVLVYHELTSALHLNTNPGYFVIFRDHHTRLEYIRNNRKLHTEGLFVILGAYGYHIFLDFREVYDQDGLYTKLEEELQGRGVPSISEALEELKLRPLYQAMRDILCQGELEFICRELSQKAFSQELRIFLSDKTKQESYSTALSVLENYLKRACGVELRGQLEKNLEAFYAFKDAVLHSKAPRYSRWRTLLPMTEAQGFPIWRILTLYLFFKALFASFSIENGELRGYYYRQLRFKNIAVRYLRDLGALESEAIWEAQLIENLLSFDDCFEILLQQNRDAWVQQVLMQESVKRFIQLHLYDQVLWFHKESFELLLVWLYGVFLLDESLQKEESLQDKLYDEIENMLNLAQESNYRYHEFCQLLTEQPKRTESPKEETKTHKTTK